MAENMLLGVKQLTRSFKHEHVSIIYSLFIFMLVFRLSEIDKIWLVKILTQSDLVSRQKYNDSMVIKNVVIVTTGTF
jgi:hypothetical protein